MENKELLKKFYQLFPSTENFGFFKREDDEEEGYFCTPKDAEVIGWTGVDGIHICFAPSLDPNMVFVVNPSNTSCFVYPVARNFQDFLCFLFYLGEFSPLEQPVYYVEDPSFNRTEQEFLQFVSEVKRTLSREWKSEIERIQNQLGPSFHWIGVSIYRYLYDLQKSFDYSLISFDAN